MALTPVPAMGTEKNTLLSGLLWVVTVNVAASGSGHHSGAAPVIDGGAPNGSHGQLSWGVNETVMMQDLPALSENVEPKGDAQVSCSRKFGRPLKSLGPLNEPLSTFHCRARPFKVEMELLDKVIVCVVAGEPSICAGKVITGGVRVIGS